MVAGEFVVTASIVTVLWPAFVMRMPCEAAGGMPRDQLPPISHLPLPAVQLLGAARTTEVSAKTNVIIANSLTHGTKAGLLNVAGTQLGLAIMLGVLLIGLSSIIATMGWWFDWVRIAGAVYLV